MPSATAAAVTLAIVATLTPASAFTPCLAPHTPHPHSPLTRSRACDVKGLLCDIKGFKGLKGVMGLKTATRRQLQNGVGHGALGLTAAGAMYSAGFQAFKGGVRGQLQMSERLLPAVGGTCSRHGDLALQSTAGDVEGEDGQKLREHGKGLRNGFVGALFDTEFDRAIFALAIPALGSLIIEPVVRTVEAVMVGRLGAAPLGALSIGGSVVSVSFPLFNFFSYATTPMVARALARDDPNEASRLVAQGIWLSTIVGTILGLVLFTCKDAILRTMGANAEIFPLARTFLLIRSVSAPAELWLLVAKGASYGHQNTKAPLLAITIGSLVHLLLDWVLIITCQMGLAGAALAVVISQYLSSLILLRSLVVNKILRLKDLLMLPDVTKIFAYLSAGSALLVRTMSMQGFYTIMTSVGARMGTAVIAGHAIARQCSSLEALVVDGLAVAAQALVAMYMGKGDILSARRICRRLLLLGGVAGTLLGVLLLLLSNPIAGAFSTDPAVLFEARRAMPLVAAIQLPAALAYIFDGIFLGARDFRFLGIAMMFCVLPATAVLLYVSQNFNLGLLTLWMASGTLLLARVIVLAYRFNSPEGPLQDKQIAKQKLADAREDAASPSEKDKADADRADK